MKCDACVQCGKTSPRWSFVGNSLAAVFKIFVGTITGSKGLVADGVHSIADAFASAFILMALAVAKKPHDDSHPYGYGKVEYLSTLLAATFLFSCASLILLDTLKSLMYGIHEVPENAALLATLACLFFSYLMYRSNICAGTQLGSPALIADAYESKADSFSSGAVLIGLIGTKLGFIWADALAAGVVALFIYHMSMEMFLQGIHGLIDSSADPGVIDEAVNACLTVEGVDAVRSIHTRRMGQNNWIDLVIDVSERKTVLESHAIGEKVKDAVIQKVRKVSGIRVHCFPVKKTLLGTY